MRVLVLLLPAPPRGLGIAQGAMMLQHGRRASSATRRVSFAHQTTAFVVLVYGQVGAVRRKGWRGCLAFFFREHTIVDSRSKTENLRFFGCRRPPQRQANHITCATHARRTKPPTSSAFAMQFSASTRARSPDSYVVRLSGALAALLGRAEGAELPEDDLLGWLRATGLITYPSPLLGGLLEKLPEVLAAEVLPRLDPTDIAVFGRVGPASRAAVVASGLPRASGMNGGGPLKLKAFCRSAERLAWAKANDCPWVARTFAMIARHGDLQVMRRARELDCPCAKSTCAAAAAGGHLDVLAWARKHGCPWERTSLRTRSRTVVHSLLLADIWRC